MSAIASAWSLRDGAYEYTQWIRQSSTFSNIDQYQIALTIFLLAAFCLSAFLVREMERRKFGDSKYGLLLAPWIYCVLIVLALLVVRLPTFVASSLNPDESQFLAGAMKLRVDPVFWRSVDGGSSGPVNYYPLVLLNLIGLPFDYATARFLNVLSIGGAISILYLISRLFMPDWCARLTPLPALAAAMDFRGADFLHYSSECVPALLIATGTYLCFSNQAAEGPSRWRYVALGVLVALIPFSKLQASPVGAVLGAGAFVGILIRKDANRWRLAAYLAGGFVSAVVCLIGLFAALGVLDTFQTSYIGGNLLYAGTVAQSHLPYWFFPFVMSNADMTWFDWTVLVFFLGTAGYLLKEKKRWRDALQDGPGPFVCGMTLAILATSLYEVYKPLREFPHYLAHLLFPIGLLAACSFGVFLALTAKTARIWAALAFVAVTIAAPALLRSGELRVSSEGWIAAIPKDRPLSRVEEVLSRYARPGDTIAVWGWAPDIYVETGMITSSRDPVTPGAITSNPLRGYYRRRFMADLLRNPPKVFIDATGPGQFAFPQREAFGYETYPTLRDYVNSHYRLVADVDGARVYTRTT